MRWPREGAAWRISESIRRLLRAAALLWLIIVAPAALAGSPARPGPAVLTLEAGTSPLDVREKAWTWVDASGTATLDQVRQAEPDVFRPSRAGTIHSLGPDGALWLRLRLLRTHEAGHGWLMAFPMPVLDAVTVYQQDAKGRWFNQAAGDKSAVASWPEPGRYPSFRLELPQGETRDVYVRIRHLTGSDFPVQVLTEMAHDQRIQAEYLGLGLAFGALMLLIAACLAHSFVYRDGVYAWYALYASVTTLAVAAYTGVAAHFLWPGVGAWGDDPQACLALLAAASAVLFVRNLIGFSPRRYRLDRLVVGGGLAGVFLAALFPSLPKGPGLAVVAAYVAAAALVNMAIAFFAWRRGDVVGGWVLLAYLPLSAAVGMALVRLFGWLPVSFGTQYAIVVAMAIEVPLLLVALNIRSRDRHSAEIREQALSSQDALTGLLAPHLFHDRLHQIVTRSRRERESAAVIFIDLVNHARIKEHYGTAVAEQSLLRSVIKLRRLVRDADTVSRIGEARFGLILEGMTSRIAVTDRAARLIAAGLMPLPGLKPDVTLQFHIATVLLQEHFGESGDLAQALGDLLAGMSARTRRPIRFLEPRATEPAPLDGDLTDSDHVPMRARATP